MSGENQVRVAVVKCRNYEQDLVDRQVDRCLQLMGGLSRYVKKGDRVLLKVNLLSPEPPEKAITTHPAVVAALIKRVQALGAHPVVGDSSGGLIVGRSRTHRSFIKSGIKEVADRLGAETVNFDTAGVVAVDNPRGVEPRLLHIAKPVLDADVVITVPKLKTHSAALFTGAVKNMYGTVPGALKMEYHRLAPRPADFTRILLDIFQVTKPHLAVMDGIMAMEGNGPAAGSPKHLGLILASSDSVALDAVACHIIGLNPERVSTLQQAAGRNLGQACLAKIQVVGTDIAELPVRDFKLPSNALLERVPSFIGSYLLGMLRARPVIQKDKCTGCRICVDNCPAGAIRFADSPLVDYRTCIDCLCCHELCPQRAFILTPRSAAARLLVKLLEKRKRHS